MLKRKLSRLDIILVVIAALAVVLGVVFTYLNMGVGDEEARMETEVSNARTNLSQAEALAEQFDEIQARIDTLFASQKDAEEMMLLLWGWAEQSGVEITGSFTAGSEKVGESDYPTLKHKLTVKGQSGGLVEFLDSIAKSDLPMVLVDNLSASYGGEEWSMEGDVTVYTQPSPGAISVEGEEEEE